MASQSRPEPMNASPHHSKVKVTLTLSDPVYVAGGHISGKMQVESRADLDSVLGIGVMMVELYAIQEVNSGEHSATSIFIHSRRIFQGPGLPPSNAVYSDHIPGAGELPLPAHHYAARRGQTTFFFQFHVPASSPSSINFGPASIRYEIQASVSAAWNGDKRLVTDKRDVKVVERWDPVNAPSPHAVVITEGGKIWAQATLTNGVVVAGKSACINVQLKNHTQRWTSGVTITLTRDLHLAQSFLAGESSSNISDVVTQVEFRGPEYSVPPGIEGIASLVVDIPRHSRGVRGGLRVDENEKPTESFFEVRCTFRLRIDMPPGSDDTVVILPVIIYHSLCVPETPASPQHLTFFPYPCAVPVSSGLLSPPPEATLMPVYTGNHTDPDPNRLSNQLLTQETQDWLDAPYAYALPMQRSDSVGPGFQPPCYTPDLSTSYTSSPRFLPPPPTSVPRAGYIPPGVPIETIDYTKFACSPGAVAQNIHSLEQNLSLSQSSSRPYAQDHPPTPGRVRPPPIPIPPLPNPHESQGIVHSPRPLPSPKHSVHGSVPKSDNVSELERLVDEVGRQTDNMSLDPPKGGAGVEVQGPQDSQFDRQPDLNVDETLAAPPLSSSKETHLVEQRLRANTFFMTEEVTADHSSFPSQADHLPRAPPTPPIAAITPIKFPKVPTELSGLGTNPGKETGLDALERKLLAEVGTRKFDAEERPHVRSVVQPIAIPPSVPPLDTINDSAISSLTLADREGFLNSKLEQEQEQEQDRDSDERTQHMGGGGHSPSEDDRDVRTQKGKSSRKLGKSKHSEEDFERAGSGRRRERRKAKDQEGRKLRKEAKGRVAAWLGDIDISVPPLMEGPSLILPTASHFIPIAESASFSPAFPAMTDNEAKDVRYSNDISTDKVVSASPNPRSSGFVTISSLNAIVSTDGSGGEGSLFKPSPRRSSFNDLCHIPSSSPVTKQRPVLSRLPSAEVKHTEPSDAPSRSQLSQLRPTPTQPNRLFPGRLPRFLPNSADPEAKYDVRSARGGRGGKVTQVASLWAAKTSANSHANTHINTNTDVKSDESPKPPVPSLLLKRLKIPTTSPPVIRKPVPNVLKRSPVARAPPPARPSVAPVSGPPAASPNWVGETRALGTRETKVAKATTVPAIVSSSHAVPMLSSTASLARVKAPHGAGGGGVGHPAQSLPPMISETMTDVRSRSGASGAGGQRTLGELAFGQARLRDLIKKYQG